MQEIAKFAAAHPELMAAIVWPVLSAVITALFKPRTPEEYAALATNWPRLAAFLQLVGALGIDPVKAVVALKKIPKGKSLPPPPPPAPRPPNVTGDWS